MTVLLLDVDSPGKSSSCLGSKAFQVSVISYTNFCANLVGDLVRMWSRAPEHIYCVKGAELEVATEEQFEQALFSLKMLYRPTQEGVGFGEGQRNLTQI